MVERLKVGGLVWFVTDWAEYAEWALDVFGKVQNLESREGSETETAARSETKFERRGLRLGHAITELLYTRV